MRVIRKLLVPTLLFVGLVIAGLIAYNTVLTVRQFDRNEDQRLNNMNGVFNTRISDLENLAVALAEEVANNPEVQAAFAAQDRERLIELTLASYQKIDAQFDIPQHQFHLPPATSFLRLHSLDKYGDDLSSFRFTVLAANAEQRAISGPEIGRAGLGVRGVAPVNYQGEHIGTVEFGTNVDLAFLETLKEDFGFEWQIFLSRAPAEVATFEGATGEAQGPTKDLLLQASTLENPIYGPSSNYEQALTGKTSLEHVGAEETEYAVLSAPLYDFSGNVIGVIDIISDHTAIILQQRQQVTLSIGILLGALLIVGLGFSTIAGRILQPIGALTDTASAIAEGDFSQRAKITSEDEIGVLAKAFNSMTAQLQNLFGTLEQRVADATEDLTLAAEVGRRISQSRDLETLLNDAVTLIQERFNMYYTQTYLLDPAGRQLILRAGTGAVGQQLLKRRHSLPVDLTSLNGTAVVERRPVIIEDTQKSLIHRPNPLLPETRSEMVVPLMVGSRIVGVLDMQSREAGALSQDNLLAFEALAGQIAIAIQNVELLNETETTRVEIEAQARRLIHSGWHDFLNAVERGERIGYHYDQEKIAPLTGELTLNEKGLVANIEIANEPIGILQFEGQKEWSKRDVAVVNSVARQLGQQVESLRLLAQADQYRANAEEAVRRFTREGWEGYLESQEDTPLGYVYDQNNVAPFNEADDIQGIRHILKVMGEQIGEIKIEGSESATGEADELIDAISEQLSTRIETLRLFNETERGRFELDKRARELATVAEVSTAAATTLDTTDLLQEVVNLTRERFNLYHVHIFLMDEKAENLQVQACGWEEGSEHEGTHGDTAIALSTEHSIVAQTARTRQASIVNDVRNDPNWLPNELLPETRAEMAVPLVAGDTLLGVFDIQSDVVNRFTEEDINIQTTLASQVAVALQNARTFAQTRQQAEQEALINIIGQRIQSTTSVEDALQVAIRELGRALGAKRTSIQLDVGAGKES